MHQPPTASLWLTVFDAAADGPRAAKVTYAATELSYPKDSYLGIGDAILDPAALEVRWQACPPVRGGT